MKNSKKIEVAKGAKASLDEIHDKIDPIIGEMSKIYPDCKAIPVIGLKKHPNGDIACELKSLSFNIQ